MGGDTIAAVNYDKLLKDFTLLETAEPTRGRSLGGGCRQLKEAFQSKAIRPTDFDLGRLFEAQFGWHEFRRCRETGELATQVFEAAGATATNAFQNITGQILFTTFMDAYDAEDFVFTKMIPARDTPFLTSEKIPGISAIGDEATRVAEMEEFPLAGVSETYIETPDPQKYGLRVAVTREAIFGDRTGLLLERIGDLATALGWNKEARAIDVVIDENTGASSGNLTHRYKWRNDIIATYGDNSGTHSWDNLQASNALVDYTDLENVELLFANMRDPETGLPIRVKADTLIVTPQLLGTAWRTMNSMMVSTMAPGFATTGNPIRSDAPTPIGKHEFSAPYKVISSRFLADRLAIDTSWFLGQPEKAFRWMRNWPVQMVTAPALSQDEFTRDIVVQHRISERGAFATFDPRFMCKSTA